MFEKKSESLISALLFARRMASFGGLGVVCVAVMVLLSRMGRKAVTQPVAETDTERAEPDRDTA